MAAHAPPMQAVPLPMAQAVIAKPAPALTVRSPAATAMPTAQLHRLQVALPHVVLLRMAPRAPLMQQVPWRLAAPVQAKPAPAPTVPFPAPTPMRAAQWLRPQTALTHGAAPLHMAPASPLMQQAPWPVARPVQAKPAPVITAPSVVPTRARPAR